MSGNRSEMVDIADRITRQAECLEGYAEQVGHHAKPVPSVFHSQATHFRDLANELRAAAPNQPLSDSVVERVARAVQDECALLQLPDAEAEQVARAAIAAIPSAGGGTISATEMRERLLDALQRPSAGGVETQDTGALSGSRPTDQAPAGLGGSRFDPARWQPIETAPKDGTPLLLYYGGKVGLGTINETVFDGLTLGSESMVVPNEDGGLVMPLNDPTQATHWMPLPAPPQS